MTPVRQEIRVRNANTDCYLIVYKTQCQKFPNVWGFWLDRRFYAGQERDKPNYKIFSATDWVRVPDGSDKSLSEPMIRIEPLGSKIERCSIRSDILSDPWAEILDPSHCLPGLSKILTDPKFWSNCNLIRSFESSLYLLQFMYLSPAATFCTH